MLGKLLAIPVRIANILFRILEKLCPYNKGKDDEDYFISKPLEKLAQAIEEIDEK